MKTSSLIFLLAAVFTLPLGAEPLTQSTFTELVRSVEVLAMPDKTAEPAKLNEVFRAPNLVRTGPNSRAELTAPDDTLTRVGANTVFSFAPTGREIYLEQGSVLFHAPHGKGGGMIRSGGASAAVTGTTLIVSTIPGLVPDNSGFKVILLEGKGTVKLKNGRFRKIKAGQMVYVLPNRDDFGPVFYINLSKLVAGSALVNGFSQELASLPLIQQAIAEQDQELANGTATDTGEFADNFLGNPLPPGGGSHNGPNIGDPVTFAMNFYDYTLHSIGTGNLPNGTTPTIPGLPLYSYQVLDYTSVFGYVVTKTVYTYNQAAYLAGLKNGYNGGNSGGGGGGGSGGYGGSSGYSQSGTTVYISPSLRVNNATLLTQRPPAMPPVSLPGTISPTASSTLLRPNPSLVVR